MMGILVKISNSWEETFKRIDEIKKAESIINTMRRKYRMTYERAGQYFRAMMLDVSMFPLVNLDDVHRMGLMLPDKLNPTFAEFIKENGDRLQLFDDPVKTAYHGHVFHFNHANPEKARDFKYYK